MHQNGVLVNCTSEKPFQTVIKKRNSRLTTYLKFRPETCHLYADTCNCFRCITYAPICHMEPTEMNNEGKKNFLTSGFIRNLITVHSASRKSKVRKQNWSHLNFQLSACQCQSPSTWINKRQRKWYSQPGRGASNHELSGWATVLEL